MNKPQSLTLGSRLEIGDGNNERLLHFLLGGFLLGLGLGFPLLLLARLLFLRPLGRFLCLRFLSFGVFFCLNKRIE